MICEPCAIAADYGLPAIHQQCTGCDCGHRPLTHPPRTPGGDQMRNTLAEAWQPAPEEARNPQ